MRALYLDLSNGLSWDMLLGSMLSLLDNNEGFLNEFEKAKRSKAAAVLN